MFGIGTPMMQPIVYTKYLRASILAGILLTILSGVPQAVPAQEYPLLRKYIVAYNLEALSESLENKSYRGEAGILWVRPEIGKSLGLNVFIDQDYEAARTLFEKAEKLFEETEKYLLSNKREKSLGEKVERIATQMLAHRQAIEQAEKKIIAYRARLKNQHDERLNGEVCAKVIDKTLERSLKSTNNKLRDALGHFYNVCRGEKANAYPLTHENVKFVNAVFHNFVKHASPKRLRSFDLDRGAPRTNSNSSSAWKKALGKKATRFAPLLESTLMKYSDKEYPVDPLLFMALMRRESRFDPRAISHVGAAGLTQIMPKTGRDLGMKNIYEPSYFSKAVSLFVQERKKGNRAKETLLKIEKNNALKFATQAHELAKQSLALKGKREKLFARYRKDLLRQKSDDRLKPDLAIKHGFRYFAKMMKEQRGDISLALAAYNAGPHRVKKYKGLPPFEETVVFRNRVLDYYREYLRKVKKAS